ncbi:MAG: ATPase, T2SS/T4P/T4SS family [Elusimicrobia bacterium]|nr:ATPase, T2SS/T4P/T4SS family [Elusimicrobiota bacterium]
MSSKIIAVIGSKGGVGQTSIAINLAIALKIQSKKRVALLDFNFNTIGEIALLLSIPETKSLSNLLPVIDKLSAQMLKGYVAEHSSGIDFLTAVSESADVPKIFPSHAEKIISIFSTIYDYVIININKDFSDLQIAIIDNTDMVVLVTTPELSALYHAKKIYQQFSSNHFPVQMIKIVLNKADIPGGLNVEQVTEYIEREPSWLIPFDIASAVSSINTGVPAVIASPKVSFSKGIFSIVEAIVKEKVSQEKHSDETVSFKDTMEQVRNEHRLLRKEREVEIVKTETVTNPAIETEELKMRVYNKLVEEMKERKMELTPSNDKQKMTEMRQIIQKAIEKILDAEGEELTSRIDRTRIVTEVLDQSLGLGPLEDLLRDSSITEIMVNGRDRIYIERKGKIFLSDKKFSTDQQLLNVIERIVTPLGRRIDEASPLVDARLKDGSRVNAVIPPLSLVGPCLTIRKFSKERLVFKNLIDFNSVTKEMVEFLRICVQLRKNIIISGGTGSGKTTLLNILSSFIQADERILTIEDAAELQLPQEHCIRLESRPPNIEGAGEITIRRLLINSLRMRPDRIVIGECRGGEALDMLQAMNTGHDGSLTTIHSNTPRDCLSRLETLILMAGMDLPTSAIRNQISSAIDIIVQISRFSDGTRKITHVTEVTGLENDTVTLSDIFLYKQTGIEKNGKVLGDFSPTGLVPSFTGEIKSHGIVLDMGIFGA